MALVKENSDNWPRRKLHRRLTNEKLSGEDHAKLSMHAAPTEQQIENLDADDNSPVAGFASMPGTPSFLPNKIEKGYTSETKGLRRERRLDREWEARRSHAGQGLVCRVLMKKSSGVIAMDVEEMKACSELGLDLPADNWTVEMPGWLSSEETTSSGSYSPLLLSSTPSGSATSVLAGSEPDQQKKASLKVWAHAVAVAAASAFPKN